MFKTNSKVKDLNTSLTVFDAIVEEDIDEKEIMIIPEEPEVKSNVIKMLKCKKEIKKKPIKSSKSPRLVKSNSKILKNVWKSPNVTNTINQKSKQINPKKLDFGKQVKKRTKSFIWKKETPDEIKKN